ncbi:GlsB/YeaQ/YmgE family stress response membrane protein [Wenyingzhuangia sp. IMCC45574]
MKLLIEFAAVLLSGWIAYYYFAKVERGFIGLMIIGIIGSVLGHYTIEAFIRDYTRPVIAKFIAYIIGAIVFQLAYNFVMKKFILKEESQETESKK